MKHRLRHEPPTRMSAPAATAARPHDTAAAYARPHHTAADARRERSAVAAGARPHPSTLLALAVALVAFALTLCLIAGAAAPAGAHTVEKGLWDDTFVTTDTTAQDEILAEVADDLGTSTVRLMVYWAVCEPQEGVYNDGQLELIRKAAEAAAAHGLKVIITFYQVPEWASDTEFWSDPPASYAANTYWPFYLPRESTMDSWYAFVRHVAKMMKGSVYAYEPWNEPNTYLFWYPEKWEGDETIGVERYFTLFKRARSAVESVDEDALMLAGSSVSMGYNGQSSTSPQLWAEQLKELGVEQYMDGYSHHPYALGRSDPVETPEQTPKWPSLTVTLGNIKTLLDVFPDTDFYLTEYGYNSKDSALFAGAGVGEVKQAEYLRRAYARANKYPQIKLLMWYLRQDVTGESGGTWDYAMYTGLRRPNDTLKPAWYAFAGGNTVSMCTARRVKRGERMALKGVLKHQGTGVAARTLIVQRKSKHGWTKVTKCRTSSSGRYRVQIRLHRAAKLRVVWRGVAVSRTLKVRVY